MFQNFKKKVQDNFAKLSKEEKLFYVAIDRDIIWDKYLSGFSDAEERQGHNCNCCKSFLRQYGGIVGIIDNRVVSIFDGIIEPEFQQSINNLSEYIHSLPIADVFLSPQAKCGTDKNKDSVRDVIWNHFYLELPSKFVNTCDIDTVRGDLRTSKEVFKRGLEEITIDAVDTVLELISQNSLYRGKEFEANIKQFQQLQKDYAKAKNAGNAENYCWLQSLKVGPAVARIKNTSIGTLLINLSEGMDLDTAVTKFEQMVAPTNYKRPTALVTPKMVEQAKEKLKEMGLMDSLERRYANETDLNVNDVLFTDKTSAVKDIFGEISKETLVNPKTLTKVEEISIEDFLNNVVPTAKSIEVLLENSHLANMVSLITAQQKESPSLFKWDNNFSWSYTGGITDSIKERVKAAGGRVEGELRISLSWYNYDDLDLHVQEPTSRGNHIYYGSKVSAVSGGHLDVDMNAGHGHTRIPVENIIWTDKKRMLEGVYKVSVNNFCKRETTGAGYVVQIECNGEVFDFEYKSNPADGRNDTIVEFEYSRTKGITFKGETKSNIVSKDKWGLKTNQFHKVKKLMLSPNYWQQETGNKHYFFFLENCVSDEVARPFFNEFLKPEFNENRKVFEILGSKVKVEGGDSQLSGLGFSETQKNHLIVKVEGNFKRLLKVNF